MMDSEVNFLLILCYLENARPLRFLLSCDLDFYIKTTLHFISILGSKCMNITFLRQYLANELHDLIDPIAEEKVNIYLLINKTDC